MNKVIRVIDLFNIIVNGEKIPPKIKVDKKHVFVWNSYGFYENSSGESLVENWLDNTNKLECEVEIIEDEEEIDIQRIKIKNISYVLCDKDFDNNMVTDIFNSFFRENQECIDTLAQAVKQLDKNIKELR